MRNLGYYGGIKKLTIYQDSRVVAVIDNIEDGLAIKEIEISFGDYKKGGYLYFLSRTVPQKRFGIITTCLIQRRVLGKKKGLEKYCYLPMDGYSGDRGAA